MTLTYDTLPTNSQEIRLEMITDHQDPPISSVVYHNRLQPAEEHRWSYSLTRNNPALKMIPTAGDGPQMLKKIQKLVRKSSQIANVPCGGLQMIPTSSGTDMIPQFDQTSSLPDWKWFQLLVDHKYSRIWFSRKWSQKYMIIKRKWGSFL